MENFEQYSQGDLYELYLLSDAKSWINFEQYNRDKLNPWDNEVFFEIPTYLRIQADTELKKINQMKGGLPF